MVSLTVTNSIHHNWTRSTLDPFAECKPNTSPSVISQDSVVQPRDKPFFPWCLQLRFSKSSERQPCAPLISGPTFIGAISAITKAIKPYNISWHNAFNSITSLLKCVFFYWMILLCTLGISRFTAFLHCKEVAPCGCRDHTGGKWCIPPLKKTLSVHIVNTFACDKFTVKFKKMGGRSLSRLDNFYYHLFSKMLRYSEFFTECTTSSHPLFYTSLPLWFINMFFVLFNIDS